MRPTKNEQVSQSIIEKASKMSWSVHNLHIHVTFPSHSNSISTELTPPKKEPKPKDVEHSPAYTTRHFPVPSCSNDSTMSRVTLSGELYQTKDGMDADGAWDHITLILNKHYTITHMFNKMPQKRCADCVCLVEIVRIFERTYEVELALVNRTQYGANQ